MTWYAASIIMGMKLVGEEKYPIRVYENVVLFEGDKKDVLNKAKTYAEKEARANDDLRIEGKSAKMVYVGIRKLINISNPEPLDIDKDQPVDGTEITYSEFEILDEDSLRLLAQGEAVTLTYIE